MKIIVLDHESAVEILDSLNEMVQVISDTIGVSHPKLSRFLLAKDNIRDVLAKNIVKEEMQCGGDI